MSRIGLLRSPLPCYDRALLYASYTAHTYLGVDPRQRDHGRAIAHRAGALHSTPTLPGRVVSGDALCTSV